MARHDHAAAHHDGPQVRRGAHDAADLPAVGEDAYAIVASKGGADTPPAWFLNIEADPEVDVQVKGDRFSARARTATPDEKPELWKKMAATWPAYDDYQSKTDREIPVVVLERVV